MSDFTPGPWTYHASSGWINADHCCPRGPMHVADIRGGGHLTGHGHGAHAMKWDDAKVVQDANARLICAAPGLLEALKVIVKEYREHDAAGIDVMYQIAADAIVKATGAANV